jgi:hypothetical protein
MNLETLHRAWQRADRELNELRSLHTAIWEAWCVTKLPAQLAALFASRDRVEAAHARWRVAFDRYQSAKRAPEVQP